MNTFWIMLGSLLLVMCGFAMGRSDSVDKLLASWRKFLIDAAGKIEEGQSLCLTIMLGKQNDDDDDDDPVPTIRDFDKTFGRN